MPNHPVALALLRAADVPLAAPSANRSMQVSPTMGNHVAASLGGAPDLILDAGPVSVGIESTVLDISGSVPTILRPGMINADDLRGVLGRIEVTKGHAADGVARASPGMMDRHYSPNASLIIAEDPKLLVEIAERELGREAKVVALCRSPIQPRGFVVWPMPATPSEYARLIYSMLHRADAEGYEVIVVEAVPSAPAWDGVRDRLTRAVRR
jgi:L-threonylcarbamoyladenylate synthase